MLEELKELQYKQVNAAAHRKPPAILGAPALSWHLAFWSPLKTAASEDDRRRSTLKAVSGRKNNIDRYLIDVFRRLKAAGNIRDLRIPTQDHFDHTPPEYALFNCTIKSADGSVAKEKLSESYSSVRAITFQFKWNGLEIRINFEIHLEYFTITTFIDLSCRRDGGFEAAEPDTAALLFVLDEALRTIDLFCSAGEKSEKAHQLSHTTLYETVWDAFFRDVLRIDTATCSMLGIIFADFRAVVLNPAEGDASANGKVVRQPFYRDGHDLMQVTDRTLGLSDLNDVMPFVLGNPDVDLRQYELIGCTMLGGRAIYVSSLGAQPSYFSTQHNLYPTLYLCYSNIANPWQLGRLIERINGLGTLRLAALMYHEQLREAAFNLRDIEALVQRSFDVFHGASSLDEPLIDKTENDELNAGPGQEDRAPINDKSKMRQPYANEDETSHTSDPIDEEEEEEDEAELLLRMRKLFTNVHAEFSALVKSPEMGGNLLFRLERSRYYVKQFKGNLQGLRIGQIEGFQPYDIFVKSRLGPAYEFIDMLGIRITRIKSDLQLLFNYYGAERHLHIDAKAERRQDDINDLQGKAELVAFFALMPYYLGSVIDHFVENIRALIARGHPAWQERHSDYSDVTHAILFVGWSIALAFSWVFAAVSLKQYRARRKKHTGGRIPIKTILVFLIILGAYLATTFSVISKLIDSAVLYLYHLGAAWF